MDNLPDRTRRLDLSDWLVLLEAGLHMGIARLSVLTLPFARVMRACGAHMAESPELLGSDAAAIADRVAWAVTTMSLFTPWDSNCLAQAIATSRMLGKRGVPTTTYLGVMPEKVADQSGVLGRHGSSLTAHAWVRCGERIIVGEQNHQTFTCVSSFATAGRDEERGRTAR